MIDGLSHPSLGSVDPGLLLRDGVPVSTRFDDVYFSREGGLAETAHVFLDGCGLPDGWRKKARGTADPFTIAETGFGTGLNFLATWELWRRTRPAGGVLHYVAVEGFPIPRPRLADVLRGIPQVARQAEALCARYPDVAIEGPHRIWFAEDRVCLTLLIGEAAAALASIEARVDAWFLDGFAPAKNPSMWRPEVLREVARLSVPGARLASFTAAGAVRRGLADMGFEMEKRPGFGRKRDCIAGHFAGAQTDRAGAPWFMPPSPLIPARVAVIGAGVAGAALIGALRRRGVDTVWLDRHGRVAAEASGNPTGLMMARPTAGGDILGAVSAACFRYATSVAAAEGVPIGGNGVLELAADNAALDRFSAMAEGGALAAISAELVEAAQAHAVANVALDRPALWHRAGGWVDPRVWTQALAGVARPARADIRSIVTAAGGWALRDATGTTVTKVDAVILASAMSGAALRPGAELPLQAIRGQITRIAETAASRRLQACLAFGGYLSPALTGCHVAGATYSRGGFDPQGWPVAVQVEDHRRTLATLPEGIAGLFGTRPSVLGGRAAIRAVTPDRQPLAGPICDAAALAEAYGHLRTDARRLDGGPPPYLAGLFALTGLGSRGLVTAPLMADLVIAQMLGEPLPVTRAVAAAVHPNRFAIRDLKRRRL